MKVKTIFAILIVVSMLITSMTFAASVTTDGELGFDAKVDDGPLFHRNISRTPDTDTAGSQMSVMPLYVPAQRASGEVGFEIEYLVGPADTTTEDSCTYNYDEEPSGDCTVFTMTEAKPLITTYEDGIEHVDLGTGTGFGERDAMAALSLDDGATWKDTNLSNSADRSSFTLQTTGEAYPGDVFRINHYVVGNRVAVAWISRFCESGSPLYSWSETDDLGDDTYTSDAIVDLLANYPHLAEATVTLADSTEPIPLYTSDIWGVGGSQKSVNYTLQGFPEVGEIPFGCVWVARGTLEASETTDPDTNETTTTYDMVWRQAERLTSGRRDANRVDITGTGGVGFIVSWQEDPDGLRPGKGLGPGEGWSGAIANSKTDIWYSFIGWDEFDDVCTSIDDNPDDDVVPLCEPAELPDFLADETLALTRPKIAVPFAVPMRLTDNNACKAEPKPDSDAMSHPYCYADFEPVGDELPDLCTGSREWTNPGQTTLLMCEAEDGRVLTGRTASTRVRWAIKPYTRADGTKSAWVILAEEKMKALGTVPDPVTPECDPSSDPDCDPADIGKNMWYHTFEWNAPELVQQGLMLNAPALDPEYPDTPTLFPVFTDDFGYDVYATEIARRFNLMVQGIGAAMASESKTSAVLLYKEGILFQGGPADIFTRRVVLPDDFDETADNPFAYENVVCDGFDGDDTGDWSYTDGLNPNYVRGLCMVQGMNVSGTTIEACQDTDGGAMAACAADFPWDAEAQESDYPKVTEWRQCPGHPDCADETNLDDTSWANPYDVSKGHRGFIDGDFVMMMYATAPNWKANTIGNEAYNLYIRRSFDGGQNWTTTPTALGGLGTDTCEWYGWGGKEEYEECISYAAGEFEQARNVSLLTGTRITVLDPRYSPTGGMLKTDASSLLCYDETANDGYGDWTNCGYTDETAPYPQEIRDRSVFFVTFETGDNTVVTAETATVPLDMYYSRASMYGDQFGAADVLLTDGTVDKRWDWLENGDDLATEASVYGNPDGSKFYAVWNQELPIGDEVYTNIDSQFRRIYYNLLLEESADALPSSSILYVSTDKAAYDDEDIVLIGSARDHDNLGEGDGISNYRWWVDATGHEYNERTWKAPPNGFIPGKHDFSFSAQDNEGNWSRPKTVTIWIAEQFYDTYLPLVTR